MWKHKISQISFMNVHFPPELTSVKKNEANEEMQKTVSKKLHECSYNLLFIAEVMWFKLISLFLPQTVSR